MKIFLSWSGKRSKLIAEYLKEWLPLVMQSVKPWYSSEDIARGEQWFTAINKGISESKTGIICLTKENKDKPWILFESGALVKGIDKNLLYTLLIDLEPSDLIGNPLYFFNHTTLDKEVMFKLVEGLNNTLEDPRELTLLQKLFNTFWPEFETKMHDIIGITDPLDNIPEAPKPDKQTLLLESIMQTVSGIDKTVVRLLTEKQDNDPKPTTSDLQAFWTQATQASLDDYTKYKLYKDFLVIKPNAKRNFYTLVKMLEDYVNENGVSDSELITNLEFVYAELQRRYDIITDFSRFDLEKAVDFYVTNKGASKS